MADETAVFFDLDNTLLSYARPFDDLFADAAPDAPAGASETYTDALLDALADCRDAPFVTAFEAVRDEHGLDVDPEAAARRRIEAELDASRVSATARAALQRVADRGPTGILTNGAEAVQRAKVERHDLDDLVDAVVVSTAVGAQKPDPGIFAAAEDRLPADSYLFVGDAYEEDVEGARRAGWRAVHVRNDEDAPAVGSLADLVVLGARC